MDWKDYAVYAGLVGLAGCAAMQAREKQVKENYFSAAQNAERIAEACLRRLYDFGKGIDGREYNGLRGMKKKLDKTRKGLEDLLSRAMKEKKDAEAGAVRSAKKIVDDVYSLMQKIINYVERKGKAKVYIGFNLMNGQGLKRDKKTLEKYAAALQLKNALKFGEPGRWKRVGLAYYLKTHIDNMPDQQAKAYLKELYDKGQIERSSIHIRVEYMGKVPLTAELRNEIKQLKEKYMPTPEQQKKEQRKQAMKKQTPPKNINSNRKLAVPRKVPGRK